MKTKTFIFLFTLFSILSCATKDEVNSDPPSTYFPPIISNAWETVSLSEMDWNENKLQPLLDYLEEKNTKGFIILYNGRIVVEEYMNNHTENTPWYWASAGKTLTSTLTGIAQDAGLLDINNKVSDYLGIGWTNATLDKENLMTCKHLLSMSSGLDDSLGDNVSAANLQYITDAGQRWAYHNVYVKMQDVVAQVSNQTWNSYFNDKLKSKIGMSGAWIPLEDLNVFWSNTRSMARFGLLILANGQWGNSQIVSPGYLYQATNTSQNINKAYGYLWWLNGKSSYHLPSTQFEFHGSLVPNAPNDMYVALGKNDQKIYVVPSKKLVVIRMGEAADDSNFSLSDFDNELWMKINALTN